MSATPSSPLLRSEQPVYIIGHKNPDADAICSALAYAAFKQASGQKGFVPARCGNSNARIDSILNRFGATLPEFVGDVTPRVKDIMHADPFKVGVDDTCARALELLDLHDVRALPVVGRDGRLEGYVSIFGLGDYFIPKPKRATSMRKVTSSINAIIRSIGGTEVIAHDPETVDELYVRVAAMELESFGKSATVEGIPTNKSIIVVGDRNDVHIRAIEMGVRLIIVTGGHRMKNEVLELAKRQKVSVAYADTDSATTAWAVRASTLVGGLIQHDAPRFSPQDKIAVVRRRIVQSSALICLVVDEDSHLLGVFSKSDILKPVQTRLVLVDHNELSQAVDGAAEVEIAEVVDHHRLGNPHTAQPILFLNRPLGSTCSIVADMFRTAGLQPSPQIAGLMMCGIISDTLLLQSPTTTPLDADLLQWLSRLADADPRSLADMIFNAGSVLATVTPAVAVRGDCKIYKEGERRFSVSQVEELGFNNFWKCSDALLEALERYRLENGLNFSCLLVTDIDTQSSLLLVRGEAEVVQSITYPQKRPPDIFDLPGIVSRKKQLLPYITSLLGSSADNA
ncbi:MAG: putative manganese-dependent inorganic diphosphatase [Verrucomicrobia bacterium]|nr:putative manganese-dependent inorganic diphosphatase [Verrucomicrobiota bacterium]MCX6920880.1 putative manganese-dependent inorganic diphosphatase [Verrucomicrobiota bacterium]